MKSGRVNRLKTQTAMMIIFIIDVASISGIIQLSRLVRADVFTVICSGFPVD